MGGYRLGRDQLGIGSNETLRNWIRRAEIDAGHRRGVTNEASAEVRKLRSGLPDFG